MRSCQQELTLQNLMSGGSLALSFLGYALGTFKPRLLSCFCLLLDVEDFIARLECVFVAVSHVHSLVFFTGCV